MSKRINVINDNYFNSLNIENCYWAGFFAADGCISNNSMRLGQSNVNIIRKFKKSLGYNGKITKILPKLSEKYHYSISFRSKSIQQSLNNIFNITERKSLTLKPPNLNDRILSLAYIVGYIDGDGSIFNRFKSKAWYLQIVIYGTKQFLQWINSLFNNRLPIRSHGQNLFALTMYHENSKLFIEELKNLPDIRKLCLARKWNKAYETF